MTALDEVQRLIDRVGSGAVTERELLHLLDDPRLLVTANVLMSLPLRRLEDTRAFVDAIVRLAMSDRKNARVFGNTPLKKLAAAVLWWLGDDYARKVYKQARASFSLQERADLDRFIARNPSPSALDVSTPQR
jgi:hypothetical protein